MTGLDEILQAQRSRLYVQSWSLPRKLSQEGGGESRDSRRCSGNSPSRSRRSRLRFLTKVWNRTKAVGNEARCALRSHRCSRVRG
jgi:hypothetical protein